LSERVPGLAASLALLIGLFTAFAQVANAVSPNPALAPGATPPPAVKMMAPPQPAQIDRNSALILVRTTLVALQQANQTGNYGVLYGISAPGFQNVNSPQRLSQIFGNLRSKGFDFSGVVVLEPQFTILPEVYENGVMRMGGFFPSVPMQVYFDLQFFPVQGQWKLLAIGVNVGSPISAAPPVTDVRPAQKATESPRPTAPQSPTPKPAPIVETDGRTKQSPTASPRR
jgi:hypothetical protein